MATYTYSDLDLNFGIHPVKKDLVTKKDENAIAFAIRNLILTNHYERPFNPDLGANLNALLFEPISPLTSSALETEITNTIKNYEPRASIQSVSVISQPDYNAYNVTLSFFIENATLPTTVTLLLERNR